MPPPARRHHLLGVWNPSYDKEGMDAHLQVLLRHARAHRSEAGDEDDVYVWWGKVRSPNRQQPLAHLPEILSLESELAGDHGRELHLYLTDYRSLYVAHVGEVTPDDILEDDEDAHVPAYYREQRLQCDCWFRLFDIRRLVADDTLAVIVELQQLRNARYHDRPVSLYGGMVDLPLIVWREDEPRWFDRAWRAQYLDGRFWCEFDAEQGGIGAMQAELRDHRFGPRLWQAIDPAVRSFIATAEQMFRAHHGDPAFDPAPVVVNLARAVELQANLVLRRALAAAPRALRLHNVDGTTRDLAEGETLSLGALAEAIGSDAERRRWLRTHVRHGAWFVESLPPVLRDVAELRNEAAHTGSVGRERVRLLRAQLVGVGCAGVLVELAGVGG